MMSTTNIKNLLNRFLLPLNVKIETLTADRREAARLDALLREGHFDRPIAPVPESFKRCNADWLLQGVRRYADDFARVAAGKGVTGFDSNNDYYTSPDADVLYALTRMLKPAKIVEIGAGNSTLLFREAITEGACDSQLVSIDPYPRREISRFADRCLTVRLESAEAQQAVSDLQAGDFLFIDSSHEVRTGNDVVKLFLDMVPRLPSGVVIHVHDIFLPYDYPPRWIVEEKWGWTEQYLVHAFLQGTADYEVLWAGHYFQKTLPSFRSFFPASGENTAQSLWMRKR